MKSHCPAKEKSHNSRVGQVIVEIAIIRQRPPFLNCSFTGSAVNLRSIDAFLNMRVMASEVGIDVERDQSLYQSASSAHDLRLRMRAHVQSQTEEGIKSASRLTSH